MIILSNSLVLSEAEQATLGNPLILWRNLAGPGNTIATSSDLAHPVVFLTNPATYLFWKAGVSTSDDYVTVTTNYVEPIDGVGIARHNFGSGQITVSIEGSNIGDSPPWTQLVQETIPPDDSPLLFRFTAAPYQFIRVKMNATTATPEIGALYIHKLLIMERSIKIDVQHTPINLGRVVKSANGMATDGSFLGRIVLNETRQSQADFAWITPTFYRADVDPFIVEALRSPFFFAWNPVEYPFEVGYVWLTESPRPTVDTVTRRVALSFKMQGVA